MQDVAVGWMQEMASHTKALAPLQLVSLGTEVGCGSTREGVGMWAAHTPQHAPPLAGAARRQVEWKHVQEPWRIPWGVPCHNATHGQERAAHSPASSCSKQEGMRVRTHRALDCLGLRPGAP